MRVAPAPPVVAVKESRQGLTEAELLVIIQGAIKDGVRRTAPGMAAKYSASKPFVRVSPFMAVAQNRSGGATSWLLLTDIPVAPAAEYTRPTYNQAFQVNNRLIPFVGDDDDTRFMTETFWRYIWADPAMGSTYDQLRLKYKVAQNDYPATPRFKLDPVLYLTPVSAFGEIIETSWYGALLNILYGVNPVNLFMAAFELNLKRVSGTYILMPNLMRPGDLTLKI